MYSEESSTTVSYTQKITSPLPASPRSSPAHFGDINTPFLQQDYTQDSQTRRISTLKLTPNQDQGSSFPLNTPRFPQPTGGPSFLPRSCSPSPNPDTHTASLSIRIAPCSEHHLESHKQFPELPPEPAKMPLQQDRQTPSDATACQSPAVHVPLSSQV